MSGEPSFITLPDGRELCWAEYGDPAGQPLMFFHGGPGSRRPVVPRQHEIALGLGVRLLCPERPGFGESTRQPSRTMLGWAEDVAVLADAARLDRFKVIGYSSGAPFALACAAALDERLSGAVAAGCGAPWDAPELARQMDWPRRALRFLASHAPWLLRLTYRTLADPHKHPDKLMRQLFAGFPERDKAILERPDIRRIGHEHTLAAVAHGFDGMADEVLLLARPWGFELSAIAVPVLLWCATEDTAAPLSHTDYLAGQIPGARRRLVEGQGHLFIFEHWTEILQSALAL